MKTKINTHEDACKFLNKTCVVPDASIFGKATAAIHQLIDIIEARNKEADPNFKGFDWDNWNQKKYQPWVDMEKYDNNPSGFRFGDSDYDYSCSFVGSRLCTINEELCEDVFNKHIELYRDFMIVE